MSLFDKESDMFQGDLYLKKHLTTFVKEMGYTMVVITQDETSKRCLKQLSKTLMLMDTHTK